MPPWLFRVTRGSGMAGQREGLLFQNVLATYTHLHALGCPQWAKALVRRAREYHGDPDLEERPPPRSTRHRSERAFSPGSSFLLASERSRIASGGGLQPAPL